MKEEGEVEAEEIEGKKNDQKLWIDQENLR